MTEIKGVLNQCFDQGKQGQNQIRTGQNKHQEKTGKRKIIQGKNTTEKEGGRERGSSGQLEEQSDEMASN